MKKHKITSLTLNKVKISNLIIEKVKGGLTSDTVQTITAETDRCSEPDCLG